MIIQKIINYQISLLKEKDTIVFPNGRFPIHAPIKQNKGLRWEGAEDSNLVAGLATQGAIFTGNSYSYISRINFINNYGFSTEDNHGLVVSQPLVMEDCEIKDWAGKGIVISADKTISDSNASFGRYTSIRISGCNGGIYLQAGDSNQNNFYHCDVRDCKGTAFDDNSFLGNQFFGCMVHNCLGSYEARQDSNRAGFFGCYVESDSGKVKLYGRSSWHGGFPANGIEKGGYANIYTASFN